MIELIFGLFILVWVFSSISAKIMSLVCFGHSGKSSDKIIGLIVAFLAGPFYWFYYSSNLAYCR